MGPPVIAVSLGTERRQDRPDRVFQHRAYLAALERAGAVPLAVPPLADPARLRELHDRCDGLCLPGGPDVAPARYGEAAQEGCEVCFDAELDALELQLLRWALEDDRPILGICRGLQLLNVCQGGSLWQDLRVQGATTLPHRPDGAERFDLTHRLVLEPGSRLRAILGADSLEVNSLHHQGIRRLGRGLAVAGRSDDGLIEAIEVPDRRYAIAVQPHPEELDGAAVWAERLFESFVQSVHQA